MAERQGFSEGISRKPLYNSILGLNALSRSHLVIFVCLCVVVSLCVYFGVQWTQDGHKSSRLAEIPSSYAGSKPRGKLLT